MNERNVHFGRWWWGSKRKSKSREKRSDMDYKEEVTALGCTDYSVLLKEITVLQ